MTVLKEHVDAPHRDPGAHLSRWAWLMVLAFPVAFLVTNIAYQWVLEARGQSEGDLLAMTENFAGVALESGFALLLLVPPAVGLLLAFRAMRRRAGRWAQAALVVNGLLALLVLYQFVDAIRMSFFAPLD